MSRLGSNPGIEPALPMFEAPKPDNADWGKVTAERDRQMLELRAKSPMRGKSWVGQDDVDGLALFDQHRSPSLL